MRTRTWPLLVEGCMKRSAFVLLVLCGITICSHAAKRVTIAQLEQLISTSHAKQDADLAYQIADVQLTERLSESAGRALERRAARREKPPGAHRHRCRVGISASSSRGNPRHGHT